MSEKTILSTSAQKVVGSKCNSREEAAKLLNTWKRKLGLLDWTISLNINCTPNETALKDCIGCTSWCEATKVATVDIIDPKYYEGSVPFNFEETLIHELLHLKFTYWCAGDDDTTDKKLIHSIIEDLARAFMCK